MVFTGNTPGEVGSTAATTRIVCFLSLAPAIALAEITWDLKVVYLLVCALSIALLTPQGYKTLSSDQTFARYLER